MPCHTTLWREDERIMITIDGSQGEGGGQILRTALALSLLSGQPFHLMSIRARRPKPGLRRQHLTAVQAACRIGNAHCQGAVIGSRDLVFRPGVVEPGHYSFRIETAGSVTLVLQTILPPLLLAKAESRIALEGGTHNPFAPPWDFLAQTFLPCISRMGPAVVTRLDRYGFYPAGGGRFEVTIQPATKLSPLHLERRGEIRRHYARAIVANLPASIAQRELKVIKAGLNWIDTMLFVEEKHNCSGQGNIVLCEIESEQMVEVITGFGERGVPAEHVARRVVDETRRYLAAEVPVGAHLADQLMLPLALAGKGSFLTMPLTLHATTNIAVIKSFLDVAIKAERIDDRQCMVTFG